MLLSVAVCILVSRTLCVSSMIGFASELLKIFVKNVSQIYGKENLVYNIHCLIHLADDARKNGPLDNISSFPFENYLGKLKKLVRKPSHPLAQLIIKLQEQEMTVACDDHFTEVVRLCKRHHDGPLVDKLKFGQQFSQLYSFFGFLSVQSGDNCVPLVDKNTVIIYNFVVLQSINYTIFTAFCANFFTYPVALNALEVPVTILSHQLSTLKFCSVDKLLKKFVLLPLDIHSNTYVALPFLHNV